MDIFWTTANERGYRYIGEEKKYQPLHPKIEDVSWPCSENNVAACGAQVFILADGHGGAGAAEYFVQLFSSALMVLLDSEPWDLCQMSDRCKLQNCIQKLFIESDIEYTRYKMDQFIKWKECQSDSKPDDDGSLNVILIL